MTGPDNRREWLGRIALGTAAAMAGLSGGVRPCRAGSAEVDGERLAREAWDFIVRCRRADGGYAPSPDPKYHGESDTKLSDLAAVTYAAVLARTMGRELPDPGRTVAFLRRHQRPDGRCVNHAGEHDPESDLAVLYNTTQGVVALRALGERPRIDPAPVVERLLAGDAYVKLPWYTTSFFPLLYPALSKPFPEESRRKLARHMERNQAADGYLGDHVAAAFHMAHFYRVIGEPIPKADRMVARVLRDQKPDGGWDIKEPDWDVHAGFDAVFILRQLGGDDPKVLGAIAKGADWALRCRNEDGGFGHFPGRRSDMDAVYFLLGTLTMAGKVPGVRLDLPDAHALGWVTPCSRAGITRTSPSIAPERGDWMGQKRRSMNPPATGSSGAGSGELTDLPGAPAGLVTYSMSRRADDRVFKGKSRDSSPISTAICRIFRPCHPFPSFPRGAWERGSPVGRWRSARSLEIAVAI